MFRLYLDEIARDVVASDGIAQHYAPFEIPLTFHLDPTLDLGVLNAGAC